MTSYTFTHVWFPSRKTPVYKFGTSVSSEGNRRTVSGRGCPLCRQRHLSNIFRLPIPIPNPIPNHKP